MHKHRATEVKIPSNFPKWNMLQSWLSRVARNLVTASQYCDDREIAWLNEFWIKTFEELSDCGEARFKHLDSLLAIALEKILPADLYREFDKRSAKACKQNKAITGRQIVWMIHDYFKTQGHMKVVYGYQHLIALRWYGDNHIAYFKDKLAISESIWKDVALRMMP